MGAWHGWECRSGTLHSWRSTGGLGGGVAGRGHPLATTGQGLADGGVISGQVGQGMENCSLSD